jgi:hypothetical protein
MGKEILRSLMIADGLAKPAGREGAAVPVSARLPFDDVVA